MKFLIYDLALDTYCGAVIYQPYDSLYTAFPLQILAFASKSQIVQTFFAWFNSNTDILFYF